MKLHSLSKKKARAIDSEDKRVVLKVDMFRDGQDKNGNRYRKVFIGDTFPPAATEMMPQFLRRDIRENEGYLVETDKLDNATEEGFLLFGGEWYKIFKGHEGYAFTPMSIDNPKDRLITTEEWELAREEYRNSQGK